MSESWHGRSAVHLSNGVVNAVLLHSGGHIAEFQIVLVEDNDHLAIPARGVVRFVEATAETPEATVS